MARKPKSGNKSSIVPQREDSTEIQAKLLHGHREHEMIRLRELIENERQTQLTAHKKMLQAERDAEIKLFDSLSPDEQAKRERHHAAKLKGLDAALKQADEMFWNLPDNFLSARAAEIDRRAANASYTLFDDELDALWRANVAQFERAVINGDAEWFKRQKKAIRSGDTRSETDKARDAFDAAVARELEMSFWQARAQANAKKRKRAKKEKRKPNISSATLTPAGKRVIFTGPQQVLDNFGVETVTRPEKIEGRKGASATQSKLTYVLVEGCQFANIRRAREAVEDIRKRLGYQWKRFVADRQSVVSR